MVETLVHWIAVVLLLLLGPLQIIQSRDIATK
jgi:putative Mn2+ efflux pump MntP